MIERTHITPSPAELADLLDGAAGLLAHDREIARVLTDARDRLRVLSWNRYAAAQTAAARARTMRRRHTGREYAHA